MKKFPHGRFASCSLSLRWLSFYPECPIWIRSKKISGRSKKKNLFRKKKWKAYWPWLRKWYERLCCLVPLVTTVWATAHEVWIFRHCWLSTMSTVSPTADLSHRWLCRRIRKKNCQVLVSAVEVAKPSVLSKSRFLRRCPIFRKN